MHKIMIFVGILFSVMSVIYGIISTNVFEGFIGVLGGISYSLLGIVLGRTRK